MNAALWQSVWCRRKLRFLRIRRDRERAPRRGSRRIDHGPGGELPDERDDLLHGGGKERLALPGRRDLRMAEGAGHAQLIEGARHVDAARPAEIRAVEGR